METKHAQAPWTIGLAKHSDSLAVFPSTTPLGTFGEAVCLISKISDLTEMDEVNAKLIAAAPDLLDILLRLRNLTENGNPMTFIEDLAILSKENLKVIDKATK